MNPEAYRQVYTAPLTPAPERPQTGARGTAGDDPQLGDSAAVGAAPPASQPPFLPDRCYYYSAHRARRPYDALTLDNLTRKELLILLEEAGAGQPDSVTGADLAAWLEDRTRMKRELSERDRRLAEVEGQLVTIRSGRAWRLYRAGKPVYIGVRRALALARRGAGRLSRR